MYTPDTINLVADLRQYVIWIIALIIVSFGFRHVKQIIAFVLDKFYDLFIQHNP